MRKYILLISYLLSFEILNSQVFHSLGVDINHNNLDDFVGVIIEEEDTLYARDDASSKHYIFYYRFVEHISNSLL